MSEQILSKSSAPNQGVGNAGRGEQMSEQLSALMDGELAHDQVRFLLRSVEAESDLARRWSSYHVISATLRHEFVALPLRADFAANVLQRVGADESGNTQRGFGALRWLGGGAIAAAVAVVALVVSRPVGEHGASAGTASLGSMVVQSTPATAQSREAYLPLQPAPANPGFDSRFVMPASDDLLLSNYYSPDGSLLARDYSSNGAAPYVLHVNPQTQRIEAPFPVQSGTPQK